MKILLQTIFGLMLSATVAKAQCSIQVNDSLLTNYDYVLNAYNPVGQAPFQYNWTVTDGNGMSIPFTPNAAGDSIVIDQQVLMNAYGCIIYQLCMTDDLNCTNCLPVDTNAVQVPFNCFSQFSSSIVGPNQVSVTLNNNIPPFLILQQFMTWTDGNGMSQGMPYLGPGTVIDYTPGSSNTSNQFFLCMMTNLTTGGCISCDSIPYAYLGLNELDASLSLSPNPTSNSIQLNSTFEFSKINVFNINGTLLKTANYKQENSVNVDLSEFPKGVYFLEISSLNGLQTKRLVIKE